MSEAELFWHYAREAARSSSQSTSENEKQVLMGLACTWAQAALMSERVLGSSFIPSPGNPHNGASVAGTSARLAPKDPYHVFLPFYEDTCPRCRKPIKLAVIVPARTDRQRSP